jgi:general secretion pathway protein A
MRTVEIKEMIRRWTGNYWLIWRPPPGFAKDLKPGNGGSMVPWLEKQLSLARGETVTAGSGRTYDGVMVDQVKKYQITIGLRPDGIVGPRTILPLTALGDNRDPVLYKGKGDL